MQKVIFDKTMVLLVTIILVQLVYWIVSCPDYMYFTGVVDWNFNMWANHIA